MTSYGPTILEMLVLVLVIVMIPLGFAGIFWLAEKLLLKRTVKGKKG